jgi:hypothetical protein
MAAFCKKDDLKNRTVQISKHSTFATDGWLDIVISDASRWVQGILYNTQTNIPEVTDTPATPGPIRDLTIYTAMEELLIRMYSHFREGDSEDINFWHNRKMDQLKGILSHRIRDENMPTPEISTNKDDVRLKPAFGLGPFSERVTTTTLPDEEIGEYETRYVGGQWADQSEEHN